MPIYDTFGNVFEIVVMLIFTLKMINNLIQFVHGQNIFSAENQKLYFLYLSYCIVIFIEWIYVKNLKRWYYFDINYIPFFDNFENRIAENDQVVFNGKIYDVFLYKNESNIRHEVEWRIRSKGFATANNTILLEEAVKKSNGEIKVCGYETGKRGEGNRR